MRIVLDMSWRRQVLLEFTLGGTQYTAVPGKDDSTAGSRSLVKCENVLCHVLPIQKRRMLQNMLLDYRIGLNEKATRLASLAECLAADCRQFAARTTLVSCMMMPLGIK